MRGTSRTIGVSVPVSDHLQIGRVLELVLQREPRKVLDVGVGHGMYGALLRNYLPDAWIVGVEPELRYRFEPGRPEPAEAPPFMSGPVSDVQEGAGRDRWAAYDLVHNVVWPAVIPMPDGGFDVALMVDVIEHADSSDGRAMIRDALHAARALVLATPHDPMRWPQDDLPNPLERHVRRWPLWELADVCHELGVTLVAAERLSESIVVAVER
jgi:SAM-dependent methyltransferase